MYMSIPVLTAKNNSQWAAVNSTSGGVGMGGTGPLSVNITTSGKPGGFPVNPNGSQGDVAGLCDATGRVLGLMPHPERHVLPTQHPRWTRQGLASEGEGLALFRNAVQHFLE